MKELSAESFRIQRSGCMRLRVLRSLKQDTKLFSAENACLLHVWHSCNATFLRLPTTHIDPALKN